MEPFPPFVDKEGQGYSVNMLKAIEEISDLRFDISIMTYARAKHGLKYKNLEIAGHTPRGLETPSFYQYGLDLDWEIETTSDLFSFDIRHFDLAIMAKKRIGTTLGNADFFAEEIGLPADYFIEVASLNQLVDMFIGGRIDVLLFERASVMTLLQERNIDKVYYQTIGMVPASIGVRNDEEGKQLKKKLDELINQLDHKAIFGDYLKFSKLPDSGMVPLTISLPRI